MASQHGQPVGPRRALVRSLRGSSLVRFGALSLTVLGALFWARQKLISPTPRMAIADPQSLPAPAPHSLPVAGATGP